MYKRNFYKYSNPQIAMACSKYQYVKQFQQHRVALSQTYMVVRVDGRGFTKFCDAHNFIKPNDLRAIKLMNKAAEQVCQKFKQIFLAYGQSDQYSFAFGKNSQIFSRRIDKIETCLVSCFTAAYIYYWNQFFQQPKPKQIPTFDARVVMYPNLEVVKDYFKWRQVDCHINNLYNTLFWCMRKAGMKNTEVENKLKDTNSGAKNQILFSQFGINYNTIQQIYRRGTVICYKSDFNENFTGSKNPTGSKIRKYLKNSIRDVKQMNENGKKIVDKLKISDVEQDLKLIKQLQDLSKSLNEIQAKYVLVSEGDKNEKKEKKQKFTMCMCSDDMIKDQFWQNIKISDS